MEIKRNVKDSIFTHLFKIPKYRRELYLELHPEETDIRDEDIETKTIENIFTSGLYNDLGLLVKDKLIVLIEAQSSWSSNILVRMLVYLAETYKKLWVANQYNIYGTKKVPLPKPEFYVVYTGDKKIDEETLSMNKEYFDGKSEDFELKVRVIQRNDEIKKVSQNENKCDIILEYIEFAKVYDEERKKTDRKKEAIQNTITLCIKRNILKEYFENNEKEVVDIMDLLYDQDFAMQCWEKEIIDECREKFVAEGKADLIVSLVKDGTLTIEKAAEKINMDKEELIKLMN